MSLGIIFATLSKLESSQEWWCTCIASTQEAEVGVQDQFELCSKFEDSLLYGGHVSKEKKKIPPHIVCDIMFFLNI